MKMKAIYALLPLNGTLFGIPSHVRSSLVMVHCSYFDARTTAYTYKALFPMDLTFLIIYTLSLTSIENTETRKFNVTFCSIQILPYNY